MYRPRTVFPAILVVLATHLTLSAAERPATVLLVTSEELADAWTDFADWKTAQGKATKIVTVEQLSERFKGDDVQQKIRAAVLDSIDNHGTRWVILGGDSLPGGKGHVPDRDTRHRAFRYADIPTDLYYLSRKSYDANADGIYGDWDDDRDEVEYTHPRAVIGRIPVRTVEDVAAYTKKVIEYESAYPEDEFAQQMVYTCPERVAYPKLGTSKQEIGKVWKEGDLSQFFANKTPWDEDKAGDHDLSPSNWVKMFNDRAAGKLHMHGHGFLPVWVLEGQKTVNASHVKQLENHKSYPVMTTVSCFTGQYDAKNDPSITESILRKAGGGAIAVIAPSREGVPVFADRNDFRKMITEGKMDGTTRLLTTFWTEGLKQNLTIGEAIAAAKNLMTPEAAEHAGYHWCLCELNLLGDPTLSMRANPPVTPNVEHPRSIAIGKQKVKIQTAATGATVCLWKGDEVYEVKTTDDRGEAVIDVETNSAGQIRVTVSGADLNTVSKMIDVAQ